MFLFFEEAIQIKRKGTSNFFKRSDSKEKRLEIIKPLLLKFYLENKELRSRTIDDCEFLPSYRSIRKLFDDEGEGVECLYKFIGVEIPAFQKRYINRNTYSFTDVDEIFKNSGCKLLSKQYINATLPLEYLCKCGRLAKASFHNYLRSTGCRRCANEGENNGNWNGGKTDELTLLRQKVEYFKWRIFVFERDNYTCQCCGDDRGGNLCAHHILNFATNEELRYDVNNGITLCNDCHNPNRNGSFHSLYGTRNNTREQLIEYLEMRKVNVAKVLSRY